MQCFPPGPNWKSESLEIMTLSFCLRDRAKYDAALAPSAPALGGLLQRIVYHHTHCEIDRRSLPVFLCLVKVLKTILDIGGNYIEGYIQR